MREGSCGNQVHVLFSDEVNRKYVIPVGTVYANKTTMAYGCSSEEQNVPLIQQQEKASLSLNTYLEAAKAKAYMHML